MRHNRGDLGSRFSAATVAALLRAYHQISRSDRRPDFRQFSHELMKLLDDATKKEIKRHQDVVDIVSWARSLWTRMNAGVTPRDRLATDPNIRALLPLPVIYPRNGERLPTKHRAVAPKMAHMPAHRSNGVNLIMTTAHGRTKIEIETDPTTAKRLLAALAIE